MPPGFAGAEWLCTPLCTPSRHHPPRLPEQPALTPRLGLCAPSLLQKEIDKLLKENELDVRYRHSQPCSAHKQPDASSSIPQLSDTKNEENARRDAVSHFVVRLAYCRTEDLRRWLLTQECVLFKHRLASADDMQAVMTQAGLNYPGLTPDEFARVKDDLLPVLWTTYTVNAQKYLDNGAAWFYAVPFEEVPDLVRQRKVLLRAGKAYLHRSQLASLVLGAFRAHLSRALAITARKWTARFAGEEADRLAPIVESLSTRYLGDDYSGRGADGGAGVALAELDALSAASFPLCMRNLYSHLKDAHHLRHAGRMQLGLFLKGIGLSLEDAMTFWRAEFCKKIPNDQFDKQYAYAIRHNYGKEGKRADYTPYSCMKVIASTPGTGEHHGCPFRTFNEDSLRAALRGMRLSGPAVNDVLDKVKGKHYQLACGVAFAASHNGCECDEGIQHPNGYFAASRKLLAPAATGAAAAQAKGLNAGAPQPAGAAPGGGPLPVTPAVATRTTSLVGLGDITPPGGRD